MTMTPETLEKNATSSVDGRGAPVATQGQAAAPAVRIIYVPGGCSHARGGAAPMDFQRDTMPLVQQLFFELRDPNSAEFKSFQKQGLLIALKDPSITRAYLINPDETAATLGEVFPEMKAMLMKNRPFIQEGRNLRVNTESSFYAVIEDEVNGLSPSRAKNSELFKLTKGLLASPFSKAFGGAHGMDEITYRIVRDFVERPEPKKMKERRQKEKLEYDLVRLQDSHQAKEDLQRVCDWRASTPAVTVGSPLPTMRARGVQYSTASRGGSSGVVTAPASVSPSIVAKAVEAATTSNPQTSEKEGKKIADLEAQIALEKKKREEVEKERDVANAKLESLSEQMKALEQRLAKLEKGGGSEGPTKAEGQVNEPKDSKTESTPATPVLPPDVSLVLAGLARAVESDPSSTEYLKQNSKDLFFAKPEELSVALRGVDQSNLTKFRDALRSDPTLVSVFYGTDGINKVQSIVSTIDEVLNSRAAPQQPVAPAPQAPSAPKDEVKQKDPKLKDADPKAESPSKLFNSANVKATDKMLADYAKAIDNATDNRTWLRGGDDEALVYTTIAVLTDDERKKLDLIFKKNYGTSIDQRLAGCFNKSELGIVSRLKERSQPGTYEATKLFMLSERGRPQEMRELLEGLTSADRQLVKGEYQRIFGRGLLEVETDKHGNLEQYKRVRELLKESAETKPAEVKPAEVKPAKSGPSKNEPVNSAPDLSPVLQGLVNEIERDPTSRNYLQAHSEELFTAKDEELTQAFKKVEDQVKLGAFRTMLRSNLGLVRSYYGVDAASRVESIVAMIDKVLKK